MIDVVGLGDSGWESLGEAEQGLVRTADALLGGDRHLALVPEVPGQHRQLWPIPLRRELPALLDRLGAADPHTRVVALASGDPLRSGVGTTLVSLLGTAVVRLHPAVSSDTLARARMGWSAEEVEVVSVVGRSLDRVRRHLAPAGRLVVLCADGTTPSALAEMLVQEGCPHSAMTAWWHLGGPQEGRRDSTAQDWGLARAPDLVVVCIVVERTGALTRLALGPAPGRAVDVFAHDGQITKSVVRASALAELRPAPGLLLWDLGAGSGAVGIEWALAAPNARTLAVERDPVRARRIRTNAARLGVPSEVTAVDGEVCEAIRTMEQPDAVFVGGGLTIEVLGAAWDRLRPGGRFVAHAVTLETEALLAAAQGQHGGHLRRIAVEEAQPLGRYLSWQPLRPVVEWSARKPPTPREAR